MEYHHQVKIPLARVAVLIGKEGITKNEIEELTKSKLNIDSKEGNVGITAKEGIDLYTAKEIVKAIARGFNPEIAKHLVKPDFTLKIIDLSHIFGDSRTAREFERKRFQFLKEYAKVLFAVKDNWEKRLDRTYDGFTNLPDVENSIDNYLEKRLALAESMFD